ncbi:MAG: hypothetical protein RL685_1989 [Pseudomonadota bacterium]
MLGINLDIGWGRTVFGSGLALIFLLACAGDPSSALPQRSDQVLSGAWRFLAADLAEASTVEASTVEASTVELDDSAAGWSAITLPHTYNALDGQDGGGNYVRAPTWYRTRLPTLEKRIGRRYWLQFDGANTVADVYVNGSRAGQHRGGFAAFRFDVTDALHSGENLLAVRVDNSPTADVPPLSADFTSFGGLYREVHLIEVDDLHVSLNEDASSGVYLDVSNVSAESAFFQARVMVSHAGPEQVEAFVRVRVLDADGSSAAVLERQMFADPGVTLLVPLSETITNPRLWQGRKDPHLYTAVVEILQDGEVVDRVEQRFGIRTFAFDPNAGFSLNGEHLDLYGVNRHQDRLDMGWAIGKAQHDEDLALIQELGATAVRLAHYQHSSYFYDLCDRAGLVVWAEIPLVDQVSDSEEFRSNAQQQLRELIRQSYNHPSIVTWGIGNEQRTDNEPTNALLRDLAALAQSEDLDRRTTYAHCCGSATSPLVSHAALTGYNVYYGWYMGVPGNLGPYLDTVHAARPDVPIAISEYGAGAALSQHQEPPMAPTPGGPFHPEEYQAELHEQTWKQLAERPYLWGKFIWNMFDFAVDGRNEGDTPGRNDKGLVSYDRQTRKDAFYYYKASWTTSPEFVHINGRRHQPRDTETVDIKVYSNHPGSMRLRVNGAAWPEPEIRDGVVRRWRGVPLAPGDNQIEAIAVGADDATVASDRLVWTRQ